MELEVGNTIIHNWDTWIENKWIRTPEFYFSRNKQLLVLQDLIYI